MSSVTEVNLKNVTPMVSLQEVSPVLSISQVSPPPLKLVMRFNGAECAISLNDRLSEDLQIELHDILERTPSKEINVTKEMNGVPSNDARRVAELINTALGHQVCFKEDKRSFVVKGSFLEDYVVDDAFRNRAIEKQFGANETENKTGAYLRAEFAESLLDFRARIITQRLGQLETQLAALPPAQVKEKSILERKKRQLRHLPQIRKNVVLTAVLFERIDPAMPAELSKRTSEIKELLDAQSDCCEPRDERELWSPFIPFIRSNTSIHEEARKTFASDIADATAGCSKIASPELFFIEIAYGATNEDLLESCFLNAFRGLDEEDLTEVRAIFDRVVETHRAIADAVKGDMLNIADADTPNDQIRAMVKTGYEMQIRNLQQHP